MIQMSPFVKRNPTQNDYEKWIIRSLPEHLEPFSSESEVLKKYQEKLKASHNKSVQELSEKLAEINIGVENDIRIQAETLKEELNAIKDEGERSIPVFQENVDIFSYDFSSFEKAQELCVKLMHKGHMYIDDYFVYLQELEQERSNNIKRILNFFYNKIKNSSFLPPYKVQLYFENLILHINQMILNNLKNYYDIHCKISVKFDNDIKFLLYRIQEVQEKFLDNFEGDLIKMLRNFNIETDDVEKLVSDALSSKDTLRILMDKFGELKKYIENPPKPKEIENMEDWLDCIDSVLVAIRDNGYQLIKVYEDAIQNLANRMYERVQDTTRTRPFSLQKKLHYMGDIIEPHIKRIQGSVQSCISSYQAKWNDIATTSFKNLHFLTEVLKEYSKIMNSHNKRIEEIKFLVQTDLNQTIFKNDKTLKAQEIALNILLDTLRQEISPKKAQGLMKKIEKTLDNIKDLMSKGKDIELEVINKYYDFLDSETKVLKANLKQFLYRTSNANPKDNSMEKSDSNIFRGSQSLSTFGDPNLSNATETKILFNISQTIKEMSDILSEEGLLKDENRTNSDFGSFQDRYNVDIHATSTQIICHFSSESLLVSQIDNCQVNVLMKNWNEKLINLLQSYLENLDNQQDEEANEWVLKISEGVEKRYKILFEEHKGRLPRIQDEIYELRMAEVRLHQDRLNSHCSAVDQEFLNIDQEIKNFFENENSSLNSILQNLEEQLGSGDSDIKSDLIKVKIIEIQQGLEKRKTDTEKKFENLEKKIMDKIDRLFESNNEFLNSIKLFSEGGNFNPKEANSFLTKLRQIDERIKRKKVYLQSNLPTYKTNALYQVDKELQKPLDTLSTKVENLKYKEASEIQKRTLKNEIKHETVEMKIKIKRVDVKYHAFKNLCKLENIEKEDFEIQIGYLQTQFLKYLDEAQKYLVEEENPPKLKILMDIENVSLASKSTKSTKTRGGSKSSTRGSTSKSRGSISKSKEKNPEYYDYANAFFIGIKSSPPESNQYMPKIRKYIYENLKKFQEKTIESYQQNMPISDDSYDEFMLDAVDKCRDYYLQCGKIWIEEILQLSQLIDDFNYAIRELCADFLSKFEADQKKFMQSAMEKCETEAQQIISENNIKIKKVLSKLKPLHGHPYNAPLLYQLGNEMAAAVMEADMTAKGMYGEMLEHLTNTENTMRQNLRDCKHQIQKLEQFHIPSNITKNLQDQAKNFISYASDAYPDFNFEALATMIALLQGPSAADLAFSEMSNSTVPLESYTGNLSEEELSLNDFRQASEFLETSKFFVKVKEKITEKMDLKGFDGTLYENYANYLNNYLEIWKNDVEKILNLYKVKYN